MRQMSIDSERKPTAAPTFPEAGLRFLKGLKRNNNREWFNAHKAEYEESVKLPMQTLVEVLAEHFADFAPEIAASPKTSLYRIHRDTRFSKNKAPYKTHVAAVFPPKGLSRHEGAGFYFHIDPDEVFIGGGLYMSEPEDLHAVRVALAEHFSDFEKVISAPRFRRRFGELAGERLVRVPRGWSADHPAADYLRLKQFLGAVRLPAADATSRDFVKTVVDAFKALHPLIEFLNAPILKNRRTRQRQESLLS